MLKTLALFLASAVAAEDMLLYVSTEFNYIWTLSFNGTGFEIVTKTPAGSRPTWITLNSDKSQLFATDEVDTYNGAGALLGFNINENNDLSQFMTVPVTIWGSCHAITNDKQTFVANYGGVFNTVEIADQNVTQALDFRNEKPTGSHPWRQDGSHPHMVGLYKDFAYGIDLGLDKINQWKVENGELVEIADPVETASGSGPRHIAFHPTLPVAYVINELLNNVQVYTIADNGELTASGSPVSTVPSGLSEYGNTAAEIHTSNDGKFLYVSNRGEDNSIVTFDLSSDGLSLSNSQSVPSGGNTPRQFELDDSNDWLVVANQGSNLVTMFSRNSDDGSLTQVADISIQGPTCAIFA